MTPDSNISTELMERLNALSKRAEESGDRLIGGGGGGTFDTMEERVKRLEEDMKEIKSDLKKLLIDSSEVKGRLSAVAMKSDIEAVRSDLAPKISDLAGQMKGTLGFWQFLVVVGGLLAIVLRWPELFRLAGLTVGNP
jgi:hypothetical protein